MLAVFLQKRRRVLRCSSLPTVSTRRDKSSPDIVIMWYCVFSSFIFLSNAIVSYIYSQYVVSALWVLLTITSVIYHSLRLEHTSHFVLTDMIIQANKRNTWLHRALLFDVTVFSVLVIYVLYIHFLNMMNLPVTTRGIVTNIFIFSLLGYIVFVFFYGQQCQQYCFHKYSHVAERWHSTIHLSGSLAHHLMLL